MFLTWNNQTSAITSFAAMDALAGCPIREPHGYVMDIVTNITKSDAGDFWGGEVPDNGIRGKTYAELMAVAVDSPVELAEQPSDWANEEEI